MALQLTKPGREVFAPVDSAGLARKVDNGDAVVLSTEYEKLLEALVADAGGITLTDDVIYAINSGAGTANAVQAMTSNTVAAAAYSQLITVNFTADNSGAMTIAINGETPRPLVTNTGQPIPAGYVQSGMSALVQLDSAGNYRLFSYGDASAIQSAVEAILVEAQSARDVALGAVPTVFSPTRTDVKALDTATKTASFLKEARRAGQFLWRTGDYSALVTADTSESIVIKASAVAASSGAWLRASADAINVMWAGAKADDSTNDSAAFIAAQAVAVASGSKCVRVPYGKYVIDATVALADGVTWIIDGASIRTTSDTVTIFSASAVNDWSILGGMTLLGTRTATADTAQKGLYVENCDRYKVDGVCARNFKGIGFHLSGTDSVGTLRGDRGQFSNCSAFECTIGRQLDAGAGAEYTTWSNWNASGNDLADRVGAGNTVTVGGSIVDNIDGVQLVGGGNHGHGIYSGVQINHNTGYNLHGIDCINGFDFVGCHFYGNSMNSGTGAIWLDGCKGVSIRGGVIACWIYNDKGTAGGFNEISDVYMPGDYGVVNLTDTDFGVGMRLMRIDGCYGAGANNGGVWINNKRPYAVFAGTTTLEKSIGAAVTRVSAGRYQITWPTDFESANYTISVSGVVAAGTPCICAFTSQTAGGVEFYTYTQNAGVTTQIDWDKTMVRASQ